MFDLQAVPNLQQRMGTLLFSIQFATAANDLSDKIAKLLEASEQVVPATDSNFKIDTAAFVMFQRCESEYLCAAALHRRCEDRHVFASCCALSWWLATL